MWTILWLLLLTTALLNTASAQGIKGKTLKFSVNWAGANELRTAYVAKSGKIFVTTVRYGADSTGGIQADLNRAMKYQTRITGSLGETVVCQHSSSATDSGGSIQVRDVANCTWPTMSNMAPATFTADYTLTVDSANGCRVTMTLGSTMARASSVEAHSCTVASGQQVER